jgi:hypothetical protein
VVESRGDRRNLAALGLGRDAPVTVQLMPNCGPTTHRAGFYRQRIAQVFAFSADKAS